MTMTKELIVAPHTSLPFKDIKMKKSLIPLIILFTLTGCAELVPALPAIAAYAAGAYTVADTEALYKETKERLKRGYARS